MRNILFLFVMLFSVSLFATENVQVLKEGQVILETIDKLTADGYITEKNALEAKQEYVFDNPEILKKVIEIESSSKEKIDNDISWTEYITWINSLLFLGTIFLIIAFHGVIGKLIASGVFVFLSVPVIIYQILSLVASLFLTFKPELISVNYSFYLALFGSIANLMILGWIAFFNKELFKKLGNIFSLGLNLGTMLSFWTFVYFGLFAVLHESSTFGLLSVMSFVSMTGFVIIHMGLGFALGAKKENMLPVIVIVNGLVLTLYSVLMIVGVQVPYLEHFSIGIEYVCSLALCVCLLIGSSPYLADEDGFWMYFLLMIVLSIVGFSCGVFYNLDVISAFTNTFFVIFVIDWVLYSLKDTNVTVIMAALAAICFGLAKLFEHYSEYLITSLM